MSDGGATSYVPLQESLVQLGRDGHRPVRVNVSLGDVPQNERGCKGACVTQSQGISSACAHITEGTVHESRVAPAVPLPPGSIVAVDRCYNDYRQYQEWTDHGVIFVTREKDNAAYEVVEERAVPARGNILSDQVIRLTGYRSAQKCTDVLRRIVVWDPKKEETVVLWTNHLGVGATTIAAIYKERWQIELFFKALKQYLRVKPFVGTSANALKTQIWTALIAVLLVKFLQLNSQICWSLSNLVAILRLNLFTYRDLWGWLQDPFGTPVVEPVAVQEEFAF